MLLPEHVNACYLHEPVFATRVCADEEGCDPTPCPAGHTCAAGTSSFDAARRVPPEDRGLAWLLERDLAPASPVPCSAGLVCGPGLGTEDEAEKCPTGSFCVVGTGPETVSECPPGSCCPNEATTKPLPCTPPP